MSARPNILLITTDQQRFDTIAAAGNRSIFTPHLNWLCYTGIRYSRAYADCPICAPSRATIMTGQHALNHGQTNNGGLSPMSRLPTLPGQLTDAGYQTRAEGKMHFTPVRAHYGFEHMEILPDYYRTIAKKGGPQPKSHGVGENEMVPVFATTSAEDSVTTWVVDRSINFLETRDESRPFFLWTSFSKPHPPLDAPRDFWDLYDGIPLPEPVRGDWSTHPGDVPAAMRAVSWCMNNMEELTEAQLKNVVRAYYACISHIDYSLGLLFARMREMKLLENTWIIFTSDHGEMLGDHGLGAKTIFLEGSAHVPLIVRPPQADWKGHPLGNTVDDRLACLADILPTCCEVAGAPYAPCDGLNLMGDQQRDSLIGGCGGHYAVITKQHKFHFCEEGGDQLLFDITNDPMETHDLTPSEPALAMDFAGQLAARLDEKGLAAGKGGQLQATAEAPCEAEVRRTRSWPGLHSRCDESCDLLH